METAGSPKFLGNPRDHSPCSPTPVGPGRLSRPWVSCLARPPRLTRTRAHHEEISGLNRTAFDLAVYASQGWLPTHHARLASGYWSGSTGRDWLPAGFHLKGFKLTTILLSRAFLARGRFCSSNRSRLRSRSRRQRLLRCRRARSQDVPETRCDQRAGLRAPTPRGYTRRHPRHASTRGGRCQRILSLSPP